MTASDLNPKMFPVTPQIEANLVRLAAAMTAVEVAYGRRLAVTSGFRTFDDQVRVYKEINKNRAVKLATPLRSAHLVGLAADLFDRNGLFWDWLMNNIPLLETLGIFLEQKRGQWCHLTLARPRSGNRIFQP